jgi:hypothetical protein
MSFKYVMFEVSEPSGLTRRFPVIFPSFLIHEDVAKRVLEMSGVSENCKAVSAGECYVEVDGVGGKSETLGLPSKGEEDESIINNFSYFHGIL